MGKVGIVTDSTCDVHPDDLRARGIEHAPLKLIIGDHTYLDWIEMEPERFYRELADAPVLPKTSQPSPADFLAIYRRLADEGCDSIVSVHLSEKLSGTYESAIMAAADSPIPVHVIDTKKVTHALALAVYAAADARDAGLNAEEIVSRVERVVDSLNIYFVLDTLEYLVKGGRAGKAAGLAASLLNIKPVLTINGEGIIEPFKKVKGRKRALAELASQVAQDTAGGRVRLALLHACSESSAEELRAALDAAGADYELHHSGLVGAVVGAYAGPDAVGCAYYPID